MCFRKQKKKRKSPIKDRRKAKEKEKIPNQRLEEKQKKRENSQSKIGEKQKKRKIPGQRSEESNSKICRMVTSKKEKKNNHDWGCVKPSPSWDTL